MKWLDTETKAILQKEREPTLAPPKAGEFALVLIRKGTQHHRLVRAICRINECREPEAIALARLPVPATINSGLKEEEAVFGQFELICCDAISLFLRSEVLLGQHQPGYLLSLYQKVLQSPEFKSVKTFVSQVPRTESGQSFLDQFLGTPVSSQSWPIPRISIVVPYKKARIMKHWGGRIGAQVEMDIPPDLQDESDTL